MVDTIEGDIIKEQNLVVDTIKEGNLKVDIPVEDTMGDIATIELKDNINLQVEVNNNLKVPNNQVDIKQVILA